MTQTLEVSAAMLTGEHYSTLGTDAHSIVFFFGGGGNHPFQSDMNSSLLLYFHLSVKTNRSALSYFLRKMDQAKLFQQSNFRSALSLIFKYFRNKYKGQVSLQIMHFSVDYIPIGNS